MTTIADWLERKRTMEAPLCLLGSLGLAVGGLVVLAITAYVCFFAFLYGWWGIAAVWEMVTGHPLFRWPMKATGWFTGLFLVLVFIGAARSTWWERGDIPKGVWPARLRDQPASPAASLLASAKFITDALYSGPRLFGAAVRTFLKALRLWQLDVDHCAQVLGMLLAAHHAMPREELAAPLPSACDWVALERHLKDIEGVVFLESGVTLTSDLRAELVHAGKRAAVS